MENRRFLCRNCWEKERKEVVKEFKGSLHEKCDFCGQEMELQRQRMGKIGMDGPEVPLHWEKVKI